jgi:acyl carrier protein
MSGDFRDRLREHLTSRNYAVDDLEDTTPLGDEGLALDSLSRYEFAYMIEDDCGVKLSDDEIPAIARLTFGELADLVIGRIVPDPR